MTSEAKTYKLLNADGETIESHTPGTLGGNSKDKIYGRLDCRSAIGAIGKGYEEIRVFFADEQAAIDAGYRPCGNCMRGRYRLWNAGGTPRTPEYPWRVLPRSAGSSRGSADATDE